MDNNKLLQLQLRVSASEKAAIQRSARKARMGMSEWILSQVMSNGQKHFHRLLRGLKSAKNASYVLAEIHDFFQSASVSEFEQMIREPFSHKLSPYYANYVAAMIEYAAHQRGVQVPRWLDDIKALDQPVFGSDLKNLRLYLLFHSPPCFRRRNIFIDSTIGDRR